MMHSGDKKHNQVHRESGEQFHRYRKMQSPGITVKSPNSKAAATTKSRCALAHCPICCGEVQQHPAGTHAGVGAAS